ncbi:hypothetical protein [Streptomyces sp. AC602_WCS936]|uniref:hypothetical protein n=1 Tax=Streptomyces sp. AC602_WCS936 TaxID=2823685 RepID=UPI0020B89FD1|nr:hypothetical protein [Streptomyces sp. AC602_WCS936]
MALVAEAVLQVVAGRLVQSLYDDGTVIDLNVAGRTKGARFMHDGVRRQPPAVRWRWRLLQLRRIGVPWIRWVVALSFGYQARDGMAPLNAVPD